MRTRSLLLLALTAAAGRWLYDRIVSGQLTMDLGWKRSARPLGPFSIEVDAPVETVFDVIAEPYLGRTTHAMAEKLRVVERGSDMVLAEHYTAVGATRAVTLETVRFERPHLVSFRLVRGPVPEVTETFSLRAERGITTLRYEGELGTDGGRLGAQWGALVARRWEKAVGEALASVKKESERAAGRRSAPGVAADDS